jgi:probable F420-dependent oxidoreductase
MPTNRPFRFGVQLSNATSRDEWLAHARKAEDLGYSTFFMPDHFGDQLAPVPALMAVADATTELRVGSLVFDNDYKHPLVLAKEAATVDLLSGGRMELGLGAGWMKSDYDESGIPYDSPAVRVDRFEEGLAVVKGLLGAAGGTFSFSGSHYTVTAGHGQPAPVQQPLPILVGGGARRVLTIAGREADIVGINFNLRAGAVTPDTGPDGTAEMTEQKLAWVREGAGDRYDQIELQMMVVMAMVTDDRAGLFERMAAGFKLTPEQAAEVPAVLAGTTDEMIDDLQARRQRYGFSYIVFQGPVYEAMAPVVAKLAGA